MRSFASVAVTEDGEEYGRFEAVLESLPGAAPSRTACTAHVGGLPAGLRRNVDRLLPASIYALRTGPGALRVRSRIPPTEAVSGFLSRGDDADVARRVSSQPTRSIFTGRRAAHPPCHRRRPRLCELARQLARREFGMTVRREARIQHVGMAGRHPRRWSPMQAWPCQGVARSPLFPGVDARR
jgi:hypothetical protein